MISSDQEQNNCHHVLVVDDYRVNRIKLSGLLKQMKYSVSLAENGLEAIEQVKTQKFDVILLDIIMPEMDGYECLTYLKNDTNLRNIPVIIISEIDDIENIARCIQMGAEDYLPKPFNSMLLKARLNACLERKKWYDQEQIYLKQLQTEQEKSEQLLLNILPKSIADRLKKGESVIADKFDEVTVLFADIVGFSHLTEKMTPTKLVALLNSIFSIFDRLIQQHGLEKIKTIGDSYMAAAGVPNPTANTAEAAIGAALEMQKECAQFKSEDGSPLYFRIGIHTGPVMAGIIGERKFSYDMWGDTVNIASRMESHSLKGCIQVSSATYEHSKNKYLFESRGLIEVKGKGKMETYLLKGIKE